MEWTNRLNEKDLVDDVNKANSSRPRRIRFNPIDTYLRPCPLPFEELKTLWYQPDELNAFRSDARNLFLSTTSKEQNGDDAMLSSENETDISDGRQVDVNADDFSTRGLEHCSAERLKHKFLTIRCTLSCQKKGKSPAYTAMVARKCAAYSEEVAFVQACHDYCSVYHPNMTSQIPKVDSIPQKFPFAMKKSKRPHSPRPSSSSRLRCDDEQTDDKRCVRPRRS